ncbi:MULTISPECIES: hypothetical protein [Stenotrophomonas]|jgi:hypothetical protein|uniref:hypothetical protein n=1 Tax=Stenotrophomonas TaxID=40323 RepID=UPI0018D2D953|nr:hypothetical protein [Stenotrophomonas sp.]MBH1506004.1 hypothetical protein [Stenotrophomonas maltophilia]
MIRKKLSAWIGGAAVVAALCFGGAQAFAAPAKTGFAPGCEYTPGCQYGGNGRWSGGRVCCQVP